MIIKIECVSSSHGAAAINYAMEKNRREKREPRPEFLGANFFASDPVTGMPPTPSEIHDQMRLRQDQSRHNVKDPFFRIEICPQREEVKDWSEADWQKCLNDAIRHLDSTDCLSRKTGRIIGHRTDLKNSQWVATIHKDTDNWHIHLVANRLTMDGKMQDGHRCKERAKAAANAFAEERGWVKAEDIAKVKSERKDSINKDAYNVLRGMKSFSFEEYFAGLRAKGWLVEDVWDSKGICRGYSVGHEILKQNGRRSSVIKFKSSEIGHSRDLMPSRIKSTWQKIQDRKTMEQKQDERSAANRTEEPKRPAAAPAEVQKPKEPTVAYQHEGKPFEIPKAIDDFIRENITLPKAEDYQNEWDGVPAMPQLDEVASTAAAIFAGYLDAATTVAPTSGGGGGGSSQGWRDKKDDDDRGRARNAAQAATIMHTPAHSRKISKGRGR